MPNGHSTEYEEWLRQRNRELGRRIEQTLLPSPEPLSTRQLAKRIGYDGNLYRLSMVASWHPRIVNVGGTRAKWQHLNWSQQRDARPAPAGVVA